MTTVILTDDKILRKCADVLHAKLNFIGNMNRNYDSQFAQGGGKIGEELRIRLPEKFTVTTGATLVTQDSTEQSTTMTVATHKHVGMAFTQRDRTMSIDDFTQRKIVPAMAVLASNLEADAMNVWKDVYNMVGTPGTTPNNLLVWGKARAKLNQYLAPDERRRLGIMDSDTSAVMSNALSTLQNDPELVSAQYREGVIKKAQGFTYLENDLLPVITTGTRLHTDSCVLAADVATGASSISVSGLTGAATVKKGEVFTIAGIYAVHPETKETYEHLQQFVVTADATMTAGAGTLYISPTVYLSGAYQNVSTQPLAAVSVDFGAAEGGSGAASTGYRQCGVFHPDAFAFVTADFEMLEGLKCTRHVQDGISLMLTTGGDIVNFRTINRIDVLYGFKTIRPELACRVTK